MQSLFIMLSAVFAAILNFSGIFLITQTLFFKGDYLFQGAVTLSLGILTTLLLIIMSSISKVIETFANIFEAQVKMQEEITNSMMKKIQNPRNNIGDIISETLLKAGPGASSISITNLDTGETDFREIKSIEDIKNIFMPKKEKINIEESLRQELAKAIANDEFEKAEEIKLELQKLEKNKDKGDQE